MFKTLSWTYSETTLFLSFLFCFVLKLDFFLFKLITSLKNYHMPKLDMYFPEYWLSSFYIYFKTRCLLCFSITEMCDADSKTAPYSLSSHDCHKCNLTWMDNICIYDIFSLDKVFWLLTIQTHNSSQEPQMYLVPRHFLQSCHIITTVNS